MLHVMCGLGYAEPVSRLAELLAGEHAAGPLDTVFFGNSGAEAIEGALKLARRSTGRPGIIAFQGGFHGRTYGALSVTTSSPNYQAGHGPLLPACTSRPTRSAYRDYGGDEAAATEAAYAALERLLAETIAPARGRGDR